MMRVWRTALQVGLVASIFFGRNEFALAATTNVNATGANTFSPPTVVIRPGDTVMWTWTGNNHSTTGPGTPPLWDSGIHNSGYTTNYPFPNPGNFPYRCVVHSTMTATVIVTNRVPLVAVTNPANNSVFSPPASFSVGASASDPDGTVSQVEFLRNGTSIGIDTTSPYSASVTNLGSGAYTFSAVATDNNNGKTTNSINVVVNTLPTVTVTNPANNAVFAAPASFSVGASASDSDGTVSQVEFLRNGTSIGVDTTSPYSASVTSLAAGTYTFSAVATDNNNGKTTNSISVVVNTLPTVTVTNPANNAVFAAPASFSVGASASDSDGTVSQVEFLRNGISIGVDTTSPYSASVTNLAAGNYSFSAVVTDNNNGKTTNSISVAVVNPVAIVLSGAARLSGSQFRFSHTADPGLKYAVERGSSLAGFAPLETNVAGSTNVVVVDGNATNSLNFYRVRRVP